MITSFIVAALTTWMFSIFYPASTTPSTIIIFFVSYSAGMVSEIYNEIHDIKNVNEKLANFIMNSIIETAKKEDEDE